MKLSPKTSSFRSLTFVSVSAVLCLCGCDRKPQIRRYEAPKPIAMDAPPAMRGSSAGAGAPHAAAPMHQRMLAAIVPRGEQAWFFKVVGPAEDLEKHAQPFRSLVRSLRFEDGKPEWDLPESWQARPGTGMRYATLILDGEQGELELSVIPLPVLGELDPYILSNVNRWREQVGLPRIAKEALPDESERIELDGATAILVDIGATAASETGVSGAEEPETMPSRLQYEIPEGWQEGEKVVSRGGITLRHEAAFEIHEDDKSAAVTVDRLPAAGSLKDDIERWRGQISLPPMTGEQVKNELTEISISGLSGDYVELIGAEQSIFGAVIVQGDAAWYFKLKGDSNLVKRQQATFRRFLDSVQF